MWKHLSVGWITVPSGMVIGPFIVPVKSATGASPLALPKHDLVRIVDEALVGEHLEKCNRLLFMGIYAMGRRLIRPPHDAIFRVIFPKCLQVLSIPGIIQLLHILQIRCSIHNAPLFLSDDSHALPAGDLLT
jgi:hypothetical protein